MLDEFRPYCIKTDVLAEELGAFTLFSDLSFQEARTLAGVVQCFAGSPGQCLFEEGAPGLFLALILSGKVEIDKARGDAQRIVGFAGLGKAVGEMALIDGETRSASCTMIEDTQLAVLQRTAYEQLAKAHPALALKLMTRLAKQVSQRLRATTGQLVDKLDV